MVFLSKFDFKTLQPKELRLVGNPLIEFKEAFIAKLYKHDNFLLYYYFFEPNFDLFN